MHVSTLWVISCKPKKWRQPVQLTERTIRFQVDLVVYGLSSVVSLAGLSTFFSQVTYTSSCMNQFMGLKSQLSSYLQKMTLTRSDKKWGWGVIYEVQISPITPFWIREESKKHKAIGSYFASPPTSNLQFPLCHTQFSNQPHKSIPYFHFFPVESNHIASTDDLAWLSNTRP